VDGERQGTIGGLGRKVEAFAPQRCTKLGAVSTAFECADSLPRLECGARSAPETGPTMNR
jgi:hypothetical protein